MAHLPENSLLRMAHHLPPGGVGHRGRLPFQHPAPGAAKLPQLCPIPGCSQGESAPSPPCAANIVHDRLLLPPHGPSSTAHAVPECWSDEVYHKQPVASVSVCWKGHRMHAHHTTVQERACVDTEMDMLTKGTGDELGAPQLGQTSLLHQGLTFQTREQLKQFSKKKKKGKLCAKTLKIMLLGNLETLETLLLRLSHTATRCLPPSLCLSLQGKSIYRSSQGTIAIYDMWSFDFRPNFDMRT